MKRFILLIEVLGAAAFAGLQSLHLYEEYKRVKRRQEQEKLPPEAFELDQDTKEQISYFADRLEDARNSLWQALKKNDQAAIQAHSTAVLAIIELLKREEGIPFGR